MTIQQHASFDSSAAELNASSKLVKAWESKNGKNAAKAGGISLMALSLAACGGSSTTTTTTPVVDTPVVDDTPVVVAPTTVAMTTAGDEVVALTSAQNITAVLSDDTAKTTLNAGDEVTGIDGSGSTLTITDTSGADVTAALTPAVRGVDNVVHNIDALAVNGSAQVEIAVSDFAKANSYTFDVTNASSVVNDLVLTGTLDGASVTTSDDFSAVSITPGATGDDVVAVVNSASAALTVVNVAGNVTATGVGALSLTSTTTTGLVNATSAGNLTVVNSAAALSVDATSTGGNVTLTDTSAALLINATATGNVTLSDSDAATDINVVAGGNVSITDSGAGDINVKAGGTITIAESASVAATSATLSGVGASTVTANALATMGISGNGAAATYTMAAGDHAALATVNVTGDQDVTLVTVASEIAGALKVNDTGSGTFTLDVGTTAGAVNTSGGSIIDQLNINVDMAANDLTVATGQNVTYTADQATASDLVVGSAAAAATNAVTVTLNDEVRNGAAVDVAALTITQAKTVTVDASVDTSTDGTKSNLTSLSASASGADLTIAGGANGVTLTTAITAGAAGAYGDVTFTGSGALTHAALTANVVTYDASAMTGAVTMSDVISGNVTTIKTGSANDTVLAGAVTATAINTGAGNDTVQLFNDYGTKSVTLDGGAGTDTLSFVTGTKLSDLTASSTVTGFENLKLFATGTAQEIDADLLNDATYNVSASASGANATVTVVIGTADTDISLAALVESTNVANTVAGMTFVADASANSAAIAYTGADAAINTITGSASAGDTLTGGAYADNFVVTSDGLLFNANNVMLDTIAGGASAASTYDVLTVGTSGTAFTVVAADDFSKLSGVEQITAVANTAATSLTLGASAETAGITRVDISSAGASPANTVSVAAYTTSGVTISGSAAADTLTGGAGADTITGGAGVDTISGGAGADAITGGDGADVITGGAGNDTFNYLLTADLFSTNAVVDSISGGDGTDVITGGTTGTAFGIAATDVWTRATSVETFTANANTAAVTVDLHNSAYTAGIRTIDISAGTAATGNTILTDNYTGLFSADTVMIGSATGVTTFTGGAGADTITGGTAGDSITGGAGADVINVGTGIGTDTVIISAAGQTAEWTDQTASTTVATTGMDIITGLNAGDDIALSAYTGTAAATAANQVFDNDSITYAADLSVAVANNSAKFVRGDYATNVFTESATGADVLMAFDADSDTATQDYEALILIGLGDNTFSLDAGAGGVISIA